MPSKVIIEVLQNETARLSGHQLVTTALLTRDLTACIAVIFEDAQGNCSLTHADQFADLSYLQREAAEMQGPFSVYIMVRAEYQETETIADLTSVYLHEHIPRGQLFKIVTCPTIDGIVLFDGVTINTNIWLNHLIEMYNEKRSSENPLTSFGTIDRGRNEELVWQHNQERMFEALFDNQPRQPYVVYNKMSGWQGPPQLSKGAAITLRQALTAKTGNLFEIFWNQIKDVWPESAFTLPGNQQIIAALPAVFREYVDRVSSMYVDNTSTSRLSFFSPAKSITRLINEYASEFNASIVLEHLDNYCFELTLT